jgi:glycopeptide antibiotics resistance protein
MTTWMLRRCALVFLAVYTAAGLLITLSPQPVDRPYDRALAHLLQTLHAHNMPAFINYNFVESGSNVVLFLPLGLIVTLLLASKFWWLAPATGLIASTVIELAQLIFLPYRSASPGDVIANTAGAIIGTLIALVVRANGFSLRANREN